MRINKIYLCNINSFRGDHTIDFSQEPLSIAGLFAIIGPTGAGKSTLLDAITLALFNKIPRFDKGISKNSIAGGGMILSRGERECIIEVTYSCKTGNYISKWGISLTRNNTFNDYTMELADAETMQLIPLKKSDIPDKNQQLIGLSYDQFVKSILLSQGEFARFLKSSKDERGKLLEDITGMHIYRKLGQKAFEVFKEKGQILEDKITERNTHRKDIVADEVLNEKNKEKEILGKQLATNDIEIKKFEAQITLKNDIEGLEKQLGSESEKLEKVKVELNSFSQEKEPKLKNHEQIEPFREHIIDIGNFENLKIEKDREEKSRNIDNDKLNEVCQTITAFCKAESTVENALENLTNYQSKITNLQNEAGNSKTELNAAKGHLKETLENISLVELRKFDCENITKDSLDFIQGIAENLKQKINEIEADLSLLPEQNIDDLLARTEQKVVLFEELKQLVDKFVNKKGEHKAKNESIEGEQKNIASYQSFLDNITKEITALEEEIKALRTQKDKAKESYNFDKDRAKLLQENEPCPLCGSTEHPYLSHYASQYVEIDLSLQQKEKSLKNKQKEQADENSKKAASVALKDKYQREIEQLDKDIEQLTEDIKHQKEKLGIDEIGNKQWIIEQVDVLKGRQTKLKEIIVNKPIIKDLGGLYRNIKNVIDHLEKYNVKNKELKENYAGIDIIKDCNKLNNEFTQLQTNINTKNDRIKGFQQQIEKQEPIAKQKQSELNDILKINGFESIDILKKQLLSPQEAKQLRDEKQNIEQRQSSTQGAIKSLEGQVAEKKKNDVEEPKNVIEQKKKELLEATNTSNNELVNLQLLIQNQEKLAEKIKTLNEEIEKEEKANLKWHLLNTYIGDREGKKFSTFAQALTLRQLIALANERLKNLSDRYLLDKPADGEDDLMVIDTYCANSRASVQSLSGGETFLVSLSLALALSDLASRNIKLESLFIDEGFGTLDPETLDMALSTLEKLQQQDNKNIGIISHVESIKQRVTTQIQLEKNNRGFSSVKIIS